MREQLLPENFECRQQEMALAFLDEVYERRPIIAMLTGPAGVGKDHVLGRFQSECYNRHAARLKRRRVITQDDALRRFRAAGFRGSEDAAWFKYRWSGGDDARISESRLVGLILERSRERGVPIPEEVKGKEAEERPTPEPEIITPSQATTASGLIKLMSRVVLKTSGSIWSCEDARNDLLAHLRRHREKILIFNEAQRLKVEPLNITREPYDDAGVSVVLVGTEELEGKLMQRGAESLLSRIAIRERIEPLDKEQVFELLTGWDERLIRRIYAHTGGYFRRILKLVNLADQIREANDESHITDEILAEAALLIPDLLPDTSGMRTRAVVKEVASGRGRPTAKPPMAVEAVAARQATG